MYIALTACNFLFESIALIAILFAYTCTWVRSVFSYKYSLKLQNLALMIFGLAKPVLYPHL